MIGPFTRRGFLSASSAGLSILGGDRLIAGLSSVSLDDAKALPRIVQLRPEVEPLVRLIEETPREKLLEEIGSRIRGGLSYQQVLAALLLAGVRNVEPRPAVGFKFHAVLVVNSAHMASMASPDSDRWLPILWALDEFKSSQIRDVNEGNWTMAPVDESSIPSSESVRTTFHEAMQKWDVMQADVASAGIARMLGATETLELFAGYAARDFRSIGHKAIYLANAWRTLQTIGWEHSEPVLRSLAYALLNHNGEPNPSSSDLVPDRSWRFNQVLAAKIRGGWESGRVDSAATSELLTLLRTGTPGESANCVLEQLNGGVSPQSIYDALHLASGELLMRQTGIVSLHAMTTTNAIRFLYDTVGSPEIRKQLLLQNAAFLPQFRESMKNRGNVGETRIDELMPTSSPEPLSVDAIFANVGSSPKDAAQKTLAFLTHVDHVEPFMTAARRLIFMKGSDSHDYKFSTATLEDYNKISPDFQARFMAASTYYLKGSSAADNKLVQRIRAALG
jgi:hypothetical protein